MRKRFPIELVTAVAVTFAAAGPASAQKSTTRGLTLGFHLEGASLTVEGGEENGGGGAGFRVGYGINRIVTLFLQVDGARVDVVNAEDLAGEWDLGHLDLGARFHFASTLRRWVPYLQVAVGGRGVGVEDALVDDERVGRVSFSGGAFTFGGGLSVYLTESLALDAALALSSGEFTQIDVGSVSVRNLDIDATSGRFNVGVAWWP